MSDLTDAEVADVIAHNAFPNSALYRLALEVKRRREADRAGADWFWDNDDPETAAGDIEALVNSLWSNGLDDSVVFRCGRAVTLSPVWVAARGDEKDRWVITEHETEVDAMKACAPLPKPPETT